MATGVVAVTWALAVAAILALGVLRPRVSDALSMAVVPWAVVGGLLHAMSRSAAYPDPWADLLGFPGIIPTIVTLVAGTWLLMSVAPGGDAPGRVGSLVAATGYGAVLPPLLLAVAIMAGAESAAIVGPLLILVIVGALGAVTLVAVTAIYPDALTVLGAGTALLVFGHLLDALSGALLLDPMAAQLPGYAFVAGVGDPLLAAGAYTGVRLVLALVGVVVATEWARRYETGHVAAAVAGAVGLGAGVTTLTLVATGLA